MRTIHTFTDGDVPVELKQSARKRGRWQFTVVYGKQVRSGLSYAEAVGEYGKCVFHSLACAGKLGDLSS